MSFLVLIVCDVFVDKNLVETLKSLWLAPTLKIQVL